MTAPLRLGVVSTHPIQYHAPLYRALAARGDVDLTVYYAHRPTPEEQGTGFGVSFSWDVDLLGGYRSVWLANRAERASVSEFAGCDTPEIGRRLRADGIDVLLVMGWHARTYWQAMVGAWRGGIPVLVRGDSQLPAEAGAPRSRRAAKRALYPLFVRRFAACLSTGVRSAEYFRHYGARAVVPSPHFVDNEFFRAAAERTSGSEARARWGIPDDATVVLFAGKLVEKKRPADVIRAVARLGRSDVWVLVAGDGALRAECESLAAATGVPIRFAGFLNQTQIPAAYAAADILALPSDGRETWGLVVNEVMASGRPAIVADTVGCAPDLIVSGETGFTVPLGSVEALSAAIGQVAGARDRMREMGRAARRHVAAYSVSAAADGVVQGAAMAALARRSA